MAVALLGPKEPRLSLNRTVDGEKRPVLPLSWSLVVVFAINIIANLAANFKLFYPAMTTSLPDDCLETFIGCCPAWVRCGMSVFPPLLIGLGGGIEGWLAESTFNQYHHFIAFVILLGGLWASLLNYQALVAYLAYLVRCPS